jgi:hypothetical protein
LNCNGRFQKLSFNRPDEKNIREKLKCENGKAVPCDYERFLNLSLKNKREAEIQILEFSLYIWNGEEKLVGASGKLKLKKGVTKEQVFTLPGMIEAKRIRIVVHKNRGDNESTCFNGALFVQGLNH